MIQQSCNLAVVLAERSHASSICHGAWRQTVLACKCSATATARAGQPLTLILPMLFDESNGMAAMLH